MFGFEGQEIALKPPQAICKPSDCAKTLFPPLSALPKAGEPFPAPFKPPLSGGRFLGTKTELQ